MANPIRRERWKQRPTQPQDIDWGSPLAKGLITALVPGWGGGAAFDVIRQQTLAFTGAASNAITDTPVGTALNTTDNNSAGQLTGLDDRSMALQASLYWRGNYFGTSGSSYSGNPPLFSINYNAPSNQSPYVVIGLVLINSGLLQLFYNDGSTLHTWTPGNGFGNAGICGLGISLTLGGTAKAYRSGQIYDSTTAASGSIGYGTSPALFLGGDGTGNYVHSQSTLGLMWNRALSDAEHTLLDAEPWSLFKPLVRRTYLTPAAGGGVTASIAGQIGSISAAITAAEGESAAIAGQIGSISAALSAAETDTAAIAGQIGAISVAITAQQGTVSGSIAGQIGAVTASVQAAEGESGAIAGQIGAIGVTVQANALQPVSGAIAGQIAAITATAAASQSQAVTAAVAGQIGPIAVQIQDQDPLFRGHAPRKRRRGTYGTRAAEADPQAPQPATEPVPTGPVPTLPDGPRSLAEMVRAAETAEPVPLETANAVREPDWDEDEDEFDIIAVLLAA